MSDIYTKRTIDRLADVVYDAVRDAVSADAPELDILTAITVAGACDRATRETLEGLWAPIPDADRLCPGCGDDTGGSYCGRCRYGDEVRP